MNSKKIAVIGAGTMGQGITQTCATFGYDVVWIDVNREILKKGLGIVSHFLTRKVEKNEISSQQRDAIIKRINISESMEALKDVHLIIECVFEDMKLKKKMFGSFYLYCPEGAIAATNTSSLSITEIASAAKYPEKVIGLHFFNPVPLMKLLEIIRGAKTTEETLKQSLEFARTIEKETVIAKDSPGFIVSRLLDTFINEAACLVEEGVATPEDIDKAIRLGLNHKMGPLELGDLIGWDVLHNIINYFNTEFQDPKYRESQLMRRMVRAGWLGRKTGKGMYTYERQETGDRRKETGDWRQGSEDRRQKEKTKDSGVRS
jgi:3-hydroxybutyryl-CoA dehydrogenase